MATATADTDADATNTSLCFPWTCPHCRVTFRSDVAAQGYCSKQLASLPDVPCLEFEETHFQMVLGIAMSREAARPCARVACQRHRSGDFLAYGSFFSRYCQPCIDDIISEYQERMMAEELKQSEQRQSEAESDNPNLVARDSDDDSDDSVDSGIYDNDMVFYRDW